MCPALALVGPAAAFVSDYGSGSRCCMHYTAQQHQPAHHLVGQPASADQVCFWRSFPPALQFVRMLRSGATEASLDVYDDR